LVFHVEVNFSGFSVVVGFAYELLGDQAEKGFFIGEDAGDAGAAFEFLALSTFAQAQVSRAR
jgi:hypothetical protein